MNKALRDIWDRLPGKWVLNRKIHHLDTQITETARGIASFSYISSNHPNILLYEESGILSLHQSSKEIKFSRRYIYQLHDTTIDIILNDGVTKGELFQRLSPQEDIRVMKGSEHICRLDRHNGKHFFEHAFSFRTTYTVVGPRTNLEIMSSYEKTTEKSKP